MLDEQPDATPTEPVAVGSVTDDVVEPVAEPTSAPPTDTPTIRKIEGPASEPIDMAGLAGPAVLKRVAPILLALLVVLLVLRRRR
jgi:hypothetical protein